MGFMHTSIIGTDTVGQLVGGQDARGVHDGALPVDPLRLNGVQPGAFTGQPAWENANPIAGIVNLIGER
jgi:hypothetical protein